MKILKEVFGRIWALWGLTLFVCTMPVALIFYLPCALLTDPRRAQWHRHVSRVWMRIFMTLIGCPVLVKNVQVFEKGKNYIVICNHNSFMDVPVTTPFRPNANKTIAKKELAKIPVFGWIYGWGSVLVDRKDKQSRAKSYVRMKNVLDMGLDMVLYPEVTRNQTNQPLKPFYDGAFKLSEETQKPIIPAVLFNTKKILPAAKPFFLLPHKIELHFLPSIYPEGFTADALKEKAFSQMWNYYVEKNKQAG
jgi:1-acyl-sn-glycerol-3-phosphate acyltransferase